MMDELMEKYREMFGEAFPSYQITRTRSDEEVVAILNECIDKKKDAYELGYCTDDEDTFY